MPSDESSPATRDSDSHSHSHSHSQSQSQSQSDAERYSRQILFPGIGAAGQQLLAQAHVAIVGCGATGAAAASLLARAGIGTLTLIDRDFVEPSNLQRQILFDEADARDALPKAEAARRHIARFNSSIAVHARIADLTPANIAELLTPTGSPAHIVLDGTDNFETRYLLNDFAIQHAIPWIYAAAIGAYAATLNILPSGPQPTTSNQQPATVSPTSCLSCLFPTPPTGPVDTCDTAGILSTAVNFAASIQVTEALKFLTGQPHLMRRSLLSFDLWSNQRSEITANSPLPGCTVCGQRIFTHLAGDARPHITLCGRNSVQIHEHHRPIDLSLMRARLTHHANLLEIQDLRSNELLLRFRRGPHTVTLFPDGRALIQGTTDSTVARSLYARFIGT
jgi:adenylyltransferase/sulfurtransferase